jgi:hypothetical protein
MDFHKTIDRREMRRICDRLATEHPVLKAHPLFAQSIDHFLEDPHCHFVLVEDDDPPRDTWDPYACGILKDYRDTFNGRDLFAVEALLFRDGNPDIHFDIMRTLSNIAEKRHMWRLCISPRSLSHPATFAALTAYFRVNHAHLPKQLMQGATRGVYSAFTDAPEAGGFDAPCLSISSYGQQLDCDGVIASGTVPLYRGEGRKEKFGCTDLRELCRYVRAYGFETRGTGEFGGTLQGQLRQQGYVNQPTVSLTDSFDAAAYYATDKHKRRDGAVVFVIDRLRLLGHGAVFDAVATLNAAFPWMLGGFHTLIVRIMRALDAGHDDVHASGAFLQRCHDESRRRVEQFGGGCDFGPPVDWDAVAGVEAFQALQAADISTEALDAMNNEFEDFWKVMLGQMATMTRLHTDGRPAESIDLSRVYFMAFRQVEGELHAAWERNRLSPFNHPGWDLSPFGYVTKTIRDGEYFSSGPVPASDIIEGIVVDQHGRPRP